MIHFTDARGIVQSAAECPCTECVDYAARAIGHAIAEALEETAKEWAASGESVSMKAGPLAEEFILARANRIRTHGLDGSR